MPTKQGAESSPLAAAAGPAATANAGKQQEASEICRRSSSSERPDGSLRSCRTGVSSAQSSCAAADAHAAAAPPPTQEEQQEQQQHCSRRAQQKICVYVHDKMIIGGGEKWLLTMAAAMQNGPPASLSPQQQHHQHHPEDAITQQHTMLQQQEEKQQLLPERQQQQTDAVEDAYAVEIYTTYLQKNCCLPEAADGRFRVRVHGTFLPDRILGKAAILCNFCRTLALWFALLFTGRWNCDIIVSDQCAGLNPLFRLFCKKLIFYMHYPTVDGCIWRKADEKIAAAVARRRACAASGVSATDAAAASSRDSRMPLLQQLQHWLWNIFYWSYRSVFYIIEHANVTACDLLLFNSRNTEAVARRVYSQISKKTAPPTAILYPAVDTTAVNAFLLQQNIDPTLCSSQNAAVLRRLFAAWPGLSRWLSIDEPFALSLNRIAPDKNIRLALQTVAYANRRHPESPIHLVIAGGVNADPRCEEELAALVLLAQSLEDPCFDVRVLQKEELLHAEQQHRQPKKKQQQQEEEEGKKNNAAGQEGGGEKGGTWKAPVENRGEGERGEAAAAAAGKSRKPIILFLPDVDEAAKHALLAAAFCVLYTPEEEHFGIVPCEAMAYGCPPIACNSGGPVETIIHDKTGMLCEPTETAFGEAMLRLVHWKEEEPQLLQEMRRAGMERAREHFSLEVFNRRLRQLLRSIEA